MRSAKKVSPFSKGKRWRRLWQCKKGGSGWLCQPTNRLSLYLNAAAGGVDPLLQHCAASPPHPIRIRFPLIQPRNQGARSRPRPTKNISNFRNPTFKNQTLSFLLSVYLLIIKRYLYIYQTLIYSILIKSYIKISNLLCLKNYVTE